MSSRLESAINSVRDCDPHNYPYVLVSFCNLKPTDGGARVIAASDWRGGIQSDINAQQSLGNPGCVMHWEDGAYYCIQSW